MDEFYTGLVQNTFSIVVAGYLLVRMEARLDRLADAISRLRAAIERRPGTDGGR